MGKETLLILGMSKDCQERECGRERVRSGQLRVENGKDNMVFITESLVELSRTLTIILSETEIIKEILANKGYHVAHMF